MDSTTVPEKADIELSTLEKDATAAEKKNDEVDPTHVVPMFKLFTFATKKEVALMCLAAFLSTASGALNPCVILIMGDLLGSVGISGGGPDFFNVDPHVLSDHLNQNNIDLVSAFQPTILKFVWFAIAVLVSTYGSTALWTYTANAQGRRIREKYVQAILRQEQGWFDAAKDGSLTTRLAADTAHIQEAMGEQFGLMFDGTAAFLAGFIVALVKGWRLALVFLATSPAIGIAGFVMFSALRRAQRNGQAVYAKAGDIAEQTLGGTRTVYTFSMQKRFIDKYSAVLAGAYRFDILKSESLGVGVGFFFFCLFSVVALGFWYGSRQVADGMMLGQNVLVVFTAMMIGLMSLVTVPNALNVVSRGQVAAYNVYDTIARVPLIDSFSTEGIKPDTLEGRLTFEDVQFHYPTRPTVPILKGLTVTIEPGTTVAFVGPSGSGKSTTVGLVQRLYEATKGRLLLDGKPLVDYNVQWLRRQIGVVGQEPILMNTSILQNILLGTDDEVTYERLVATCRIANCYDFIIALPQQFDTVVGSSGGMLSGGQKQRIAIARALINNPKILLLDEATSALDTQSEKIVQAALSAAAAGRTTITVAHRLSTIKDATQILVMKAGEVLERGTHDDLYRMNGIYHDLVEKQTIAQAIDSKVEATPVEQAAETESKPAEHTVVQVPVAKDLMGKTFKLASAAEMVLDANQRRRAEKKASKESNPGTFPTTWRIIKLMPESYHYILAGVVFSLIAGTGMPLYSLVMAKVTLLLISQSPEQILSAGGFEGINRLCTFFVFIGIGTFVGRAIGISSFGRAAASLTRKVRVLLFSSYLTKEVGFFDEPSHTVGILAARLATDSEQVCAAITEAWADIANVVACVVAGLTIGFIYAANVTGIILLMTPFIVYSGITRARAIKGFEDDAKSAYEEASDIAAEAIREVKTVRALCRQPYYVQKYTASLDHPARLGVIKALRDSIGAALEKAAGHFTTAVGFYAGLRLIQDGHISFEGLFISLIVTMITAQQIGLAATFTSALHKGVTAANNVFRVLDAPTLIDADLPGEEVQDFKAEFSFKDVAFRYPARPDQVIFEGHFQLEGKQNKTIALVGPSGCGKSTTIGMLQRWYDALSGSITVSGRPITSLQVKSGLRKHVALVGQEPMLLGFGSIGDNIAWGKDETEPPATEAEIIEAAQMANIHEFIDSLPEKYNTPVGARGSQLSGGQKQRIAIARALIRKPKLLLLDEATSALDSESEKKIQAVLDAAREGRTVLTIAHRLSTIQNADAIAVVSRGRVIELGTHQELLALNGLYADLVRQQDLTMST